MSEETSELKDLIQVLNSGIDFYQNAHEKVQDTQVKHVFESVIAAKQQALGQLQPLMVNREGEKEAGNSWATKAREVYANTLAAVSSNSDNTYIAQLEEVEDETLEAVKELTEEATSPEVISELASIRTSMQSCHDQMLALQKATA